MIDPASGKLTLRAAALARRRALGDAARAAAALTIAELAAHLEVGPGAIVAGYAPIRDEIDPQPLLRALAARGATLALPCIAGKAEPLLFRVWREGDPLQRGAFGISEPSPEASLVFPDIVLVPLAAFDRRGHRIGYGAGYYDRTLAAVRRTKPVVAMGLAFAVQEIGQVPAEPHDVPLDLVLTESGIIATGSS